MPPVPPQLNPIAAPLNSLSRAARWSAFLVAAVITGAYAFAAGLWGRSFLTMTDVGWYIRLASGDIHRVMQPFASRQLGPAVVRFLSWALHWPVERAFVLEGTISMIVLVAVVYLLMMRTTAPRWILAAVAVVPFWPQLYFGLGLPDLWYAAMIAIFLMLLAQRHFLAAAFMMLPLMLSRESTSLVLVCFLIAGWRPLGWRGRLLALGSALAGTVFIQHLTAHNPGNREHLPQSVYMLSKIPWNFMRNVLGIIPWSNVYPQLCRAPVWQHSLELGPIHAIGVCGISENQSIMALFELTTVFGLLPLLTIFLWWRSRRQKGRSLLLNFCLLYGGVSVLLSPLLGAGVGRLLGYSWPFCLVALPLLFDDLRQRYAAALGSKGMVAGLGFLSLHGLACALSAALPTLTPAGVGVGLWVAGYLLLRWWFGTAEESPEKRLPGNPADAATGA